MTLASRDESQLYGLELHGGGSMAYIVQYRISAKGLIELVKVESRHRTTPGPRRRVPRGA